MACRHKFHKDLNLEKLNFEPVTLIVGTFNPEWPENNSAKWFYGRTHDKDGKQSNNFWNVLPRLYNEPSLINETRKEWKCFCKRNYIAITDLIECIEDADKNNQVHVKYLKSYRDSDIVNKFFNHTIVNIKQLLENHPSIKNVYLTRSVGEEFWKNLWHPITVFAGQNKLFNKILLTPSGWAKERQDAYNLENPNNPIPLLHDYILMRWKQVWHKMDSIGNSTT